MNSTRPVDTEWDNFINAHVSWVNGWIVPGKESKYTSVESRLKLLQMIIDSGSLLPTEKLKLQCLGTYFGVVICDYTGWKFELYNDEYGEDLSIKVKDKESRIFPVTMISKRIEDGEKVNVFELFTKIIPLAKEHFADDDVI
jgi:Domain of unknown function (DUF3806)